jgi:hypothetical protein
MEEETTHEETAATQAEKAEMMERLQEEIRSLPVADHVVYMMHSLSSLAVGRMGLMPDSEAECDLDQARLAIDAFKALVEVMERANPAAEMAAHRGMLSQLQLAYVGALDAASASKADGAGAAPAGTDVPPEEPELAPEAAPEEPDRS